MITLLLSLGLCAIGFIVLVATVQFIIDLIKDYYDEK